MKKLIFYILTTLSIPGALVQQHQMKKDTAMKRMDMEGMQMDSMKSMTMNSQYSLDVPMSRMIPAHHGCRTKRRCMASGYMARNG